MRTWMQTGLFAAAAVLLAPGVARAQTNSSAAAEPSSDEELIAGGVALRKSGQDSEALAIFERAYAVRRSSRALAQIALAHQALAHWREAEQALLEVLHDPIDPWIARYRADLEDSLAAVRTHLAWLEVDSDVSGAEVRIAGQPVGRLPIYGGVRVLAGELVVEARAPGYPPMERHLSVEAASRAHVAFLFAAPRADAVSQESGTAKLHPPLERLPSPTRQAGWIAFAGATGLALVGVAGMVTREVEAQIWNDDRRCGPLGAQLRIDRCGTNRDIGAAAESIGIGAFVGSGVALALSGWLLLRGAPAPSPATASGVACGWSGTAIACRASF